MPQALSFSSKGNREKRLVNVQTRRKGWSHLTKDRAGKIRDMRNGSGIPYRTYPAPSINHQKASRKTEPIHIFYDDSLLAGMATVQQDDDLLLTQELGLWVGG